MTIENEFQAFLKAGYPNGISQHNETKNRMIFFAGATAIFKKISIESTDNSIHDILKAISEETEEYIEGLNE